MAATDVQTILDDLTLCSKDIEAFRSLSLVQFNYKPDVSKWSVAQCVDHLRLANRAYEKVIVETLEPNRKSSFWERVPLLPGVFGNVLVNALEPGRRGIRTTESFEPAQSSFELSLLDDFSVSQQSIREAIESVSHLEMRKLIVTSVFAKFVVYSLYDACRIVAVHERRHIVQAQNVIASEGYPD